MELLLNLIWVLLAVPAFWVWRREAVHSRRSRFLSPVRCVFALAFILLLLFPVISATDDLRAMQPETEESPSVCRASRNAESHKDHIATLGTTPAVAGDVAAFPPADECSGLVVGFTVTLPVAILESVPSGRAPPASLIS